MPLFLLNLLPLFSKALPFFKGYWKIIIPVVGFVLLFWAFNARGNKIDVLKLEQAQYVEWAEQQIRVNESNLATIASLEAANAELAASVSVSEAARIAAYAASLERERKAIAELNAAVNQLQELENETPACAELSRIDIGAACPLSVEQLRRAAQGSLDRD